MEFPVDQVGLSSFSSIDAILENRSLKEKFKSIKVHICNYSLITKEHSIAFKQMYFVNKFRNNMIPSE